MASRREGETSVLSGCVLERVPEADGRGRVGVEEDGVLVWWHTAADLGLLADDHGLEHARVFEVEIAGDGGILLVDGGFGEGRVQVVQVVADFVDSAVFGLVQGAVGIEGVWWRISLDGGLYWLGTMRFYIPSSKKNRTLSPLSRK